MATLPWIALLWLPVLVIERRLVSDPLERRLHLAFILVLLATNSSGPALGADAILQDPVSLERAVRGVLAALALVVTVPVLVRQRSVLFSRHLTWVPLLGLYVLVAGISAVYSVAPIVTAAKALELLTGFLIVVGVTTLDSPVLPLKRSIVLLIALEGVLMAASVIGFFAMASIFSTFDSRAGFITERTLSGVFMSPNALSVVGAVVAVFALARLLKKPRAPHRAVLFAGVLFGVTAVVLASGRQGLIILVVSTAAVLLILKPFQAVFWVLPAIIALGVLYANELATAFTRGQGSQLLRSLSGRTVWWESALSAWLEHPWLGFGFAVGGRFVALERIGASDVSSLHSGYLEVLTGVGVLGFIPLIIVLFGVGRFCLRVIRVETEYAILLIPLALHSFISPGFGGWLNTDFLILGLLAGLADTWAPDDGAIPYLDFAGAARKPFGSSPKVFDDLRIGNVLETVESDQLLEPEGVGLEAVLGPGLGHSQPRHGHGGVVPEEIGTRWSPASRLPVVEEDPLPHPAKVPWSQIPVHRCRAACSRHQLPPRLTKALDLFYHASQRHRASHNRMNVRW